MPTPYYVIFAALVGVLLGLYIAESDIKRDCKKLNMVVLLNQSFECKVSDYE